MKKSDVNGSGTNEVYKWLKSQKSGFLGISMIKVRLVFTLGRSGDKILTWNFGRSGTLKSFWSIRMVKLYRGGARGLHPRRSTERLPSFSLHKDLAHLNSLH